MPSAFAQELRSALENRRLTLGRVSDRLERRGVRCSPSTLSLWSRGHTRPAMPRSAAVLAALDEELGLAAGTLRNALEDPSVGQPAWWDSRVPIHLVSDAYEAFEQFRRSTGLDRSDDLARLRGHTIVHVGQDRTTERVEVRQVLRTTHGGPQQIAVYVHMNDLTPDGQPQMLRLDNVLGGTVLARAQFDAIGAVAVLVGLDQPLAPGEVTTLEYEWVRITELAPAADDYYETRSPRPLGSSRLEVCFAGDLPSRVRTIATRRTPGDVALASLPHDDVTPNQCVQVSAHDVVGGGLRVAWSWEEGGEGADG